MRIRTNTHYFRFMYLLIVPGHVLAVRLLAAELFLALTAIPLLLLCCVAFKVTFHLGLVFRWFKFTLTPPYSIAHDKLRLAIWDTSFWTFWLKFGHKGP